MKRIIATLLFCTALSTPALAESPVVRNLHSWDYVQQVANPPAPAEAPAAEHAHPYYHHEAKAHEGKKHHHKHGAKKAGAAHHHHHKKDAMKDKPKDQPKQ